jgi:4-amino-4-deoxy-L-arabinose transferase-like glycosyltransferase
MVRDSNTDRQASIGGKILTASHHRIVALSLLVVASFALRVAAIKIWGTGAIEPDGAQYARIAENLRKGVGYVGIATPGPELNFPPLFPLLIDAASFVTKSHSSAGRLVSLVLGALLPLPVFGIASRLFNRRTAWVAAVLALLHPLLINLSFTVWSEGPYATLLLTAVYVVLRALNHPSIQMWALVGGTFGLAYLLRPEAVAPMMVAALFALIATEGPQAIRCQRAVVAIAVFAALTLPEVILIYRYTGKLRLEGKSAIIYAQSIRIFDARASLEGDRRSTGAQLDEPSPQPNAESWQPWPEKWAGHAINTNLEPTGVWMRPNADVIRETRITPKVLAHIVRTAARLNAPALLEQLSSRWLGAPFLPALALLGALRRPWPRPLASSYLYVMLVPATAVVATFSTIWNYPRFYFLLVPFLLIWAANGLVGFGEWTKASSAAIGWQGLGPVVFAYVIPGLIGLAMVIYPIGGVRSLYEFTVGSPLTRVDKQVGLWIAQQQKGQVRIMDLTVPLAFHADAEFAYFPYCSGDLALRFLDAANVDYVVLRRQEKFTKYYEDWLAHGIPDPRAQLVYLSSGANSPEILVYRWHRPDSALRESPDPLGRADEAFALKMIQFPLDGITSFSMLHPKSMSFLHPCLVSVSDYFHFVIDACSQRSGRSMNHRWSEGA